MSIFYSFLSFSINSFFFKKKNRSKLPLAAVGDLETRISESQKVSIKTCPDITALDNLVGKTIVKAFSE